MSLTLGTGASCMNWLVLLARDFGFGPVPITGLNLLSTWSPPFVFLLGDSTVTATGVITGSKCLVIGPCGVRSVKFARGSVSLTCAEKD